MLPTRDYIDIEDIMNDLLIFKDGSACMVLEVTAVNFGLFSEKEQEATIYAYAQLLNSLTFSIQIVVTSKRKDVSDYIQNLDNQLAQNTSPQIRTQLAKYRDFVKAIVRQGNVLDKKFYIAIPFSAMELGFGSAFSALSPKKKTLSLPKEDIAERAFTSLSPKRDHLIRLLTRIGLRGTQLNSQQLLQLFYDYFNPNQLGTRVTFPAPPK